MIIWLTGMSCAGKTTIAKALAERLRADAVEVEILDGDEVRNAFGNALGFQRVDRDENIQRLGYMANLLSKHNIVVIVAAISPYRAARDRVRATSPQFMEVFVNASLATCESRDVKGLYKRARSGEIANFTGVSDPYEPPLHPEIACWTEFESIEESVEKILSVFYHQLARKQGNESL